MESITILPAELLQIWIFPEKKGTAPSYGQKVIPKETQQLLVSPDGEKGSLKIGQKAWIHRMEMNSGQSVEMKLHSKGAGFYVFLIEGKLLVDSGNQTIEPTRLTFRDAVGFYDASILKLSAQSPSLVLILEIPVR